MRRSPSNHPLGVEEPATGNKSCRTLAVTKTRSGVSTGPRIVRPRSWARTFWWWQWQSGPAGEDRPTRAAPTGKTADKQARIGVISPASRSRLAHHAGSAGRTFWWQWQSGARRRRSSNMGGAPREKLLTSRRVSVYFRRLLAVDWLIMPLRLVIERSLRRGASIGVIRYSI